MIVSDLLNNTLACLFIHPCVLLGDFEVHVQLQQNLVCSGTVAKLRTELGGRK